ncbi:energy transducer TonB [Aquirhabdus parva]|uniref:Energy transducer TonB n=1 Tax=Aquirhabdus parva TaxID=2283318 RepID=A0A345P7P8_9GAMM|nr:TonB family protein [Aquirhabdus parva]AXI03307.1 energy transducer TonB [Aquirhabdus parva]
MVELQLKRFYLSKPIQVIGQWFSELTSQMIEKSRTDRILTISILAAVAVHVFFIFAITFSAPHDDQAVMQDIALAVSDSKKDNPDADYLAQANQEGSGVLRSAHRLTSPAQVQNQNQSIQAQNVTIQIIKEEQEELTPSAAGERTVTTAASWKAETQEEKNRRMRKAQKQKESSSSTASMIATLEAQYATQKQEYSKISSIHTVDSVSTKADPSAVYLNQFRRKVEKIGNHNYPIEARNRGIKGDVRLMVILERDGSIRAIRLMQTSGYHILDEAAKASVREGAPYGRFDDAMKGYSQLHIIRTWRFSDENELDVGT